MGSSKEYRFWLITLVQHLAQENCEGRLRELCQYLLGPVFSSKKTKWEPVILGIDKREMLLEILTVMTSNLRLQRLYLEFKEQLDLIKPANTA